MKIVVIFLIAGCFMTTFSQEIPVTVKKQVDNFLEKKTYLNQNCHRSGKKAGGAEFFDDAQDMTTNAIMVELEDDGDSPNTFKKWDNSFDSECQFEFRQPSDRLIEKLKARFEKTGLTDYQYDPKINILRFSAGLSEKEFAIGVLQNQINPLSEILLEQEANRIAKKWLAGFKNKIEFDKTWTIAGNGQITEYHMVFRRIFRHGIILDNISFVEVILFSDGRLKSIVIRWPKITSLPKAETTFEDFKVSASIRDMYSKFSSIMIDSDTKRIPVSADIDGVALAWKKLPDSEAYNVLSPCYAFKGVITFADGEKQDVYLEVPRLKKYHSQ
jgi:hypothetical protein